VDQDAAQFVRIKAQRGIEYDAALADETCGVNLLAAPAGVQTSPVNAQTLGPFNPDWRAQQRR